MTHFQFQVQVEMKRLQVSLDPSCCFHPYYHSCAMSTSMIQYQARKNLQTEHPPLHLLHSDPTLPRLGLSFHHPTTLHNVQYVVMVLCQIPLDGSM